MEPARRPLLRSPLADLCLTGLVALIVLDLALFQPLVGSGYIRRHWHEFFAALVIGLGVVAVWSRESAARMLAVLGVALALIRLANFWVPDSTVRFWDATLYLAAVLTLAYVVGRQVFGNPGRMNWHRVVGAVAIWLLAGLAFAQAYRLVAMHVPVAFFVQGAPADYDAIVASLNYYSLVTLATVGYGDIVPVHPFVRGFAVVESVFGVMYPVLVISSLVSQEISAGGNP
jgi:hypothetical protein